jgi:adenine C2-methylase RlmN of 23S rRNA A2503 and tRNA A37
VPTVYDLSPEALTDTFTSWGEPAFRAKQVWTQLWKRAATYDGMSEISPILRERLEAELPIGVEVVDERAVATKPRPGRAPSRRRGSMSYQGASSR